VLVGTVFLAIAGGALMKMSKSAQGQKAMQLRVGGGAAFAAAVVVLLLGCIRIVEPGYAAVQILFGKVREEPLLEGMHLINPFVDIEKLSIRTEAYTMSARHYEGEVVGDDAIVTLSKDGLSLKLDVTVLYKLDPKAAPRIYRELGPEFVRKVVRPAVRTVIRTQTAQHLAKDIYTEKREELVLAIQAGLKKEIEGRGLILERVMLRNVELPQRLQQQITEKLAAEQEAQKMEFVIKKEELEAKRKKTEAQGISESNKIISGSLSTEYLQWYYIKTLEQLVRSPNNTVIILPFDQKLTPLIQIPGGVNKR